VSAATVGQFCSNSTLPHTESPLLQIRGQIVSLYLLFMFLTLTSEICIKEEDVLY